MRRDGVVTGYLWGKNMPGKVKVKGKPTNASKASARCRRSKCSFCHHQPVSKARSKTKGRNKRLARRLLDADDAWSTFSEFAPARHVKARSPVPSRFDCDRVLSKAKSKSKSRTKHALPRLLVDDDDEPAFGNLVPAHHVMAVVSSPWTHVNSYTCYALNACYSDVKVVGHDDDDGTWDVYDGYHIAEANLVLGHEFDDGERDAEEENDDHEINVADDVSTDVGIHPHDDVKEGMHSHDDVGTDAGIHQHDDVKEGMHSHDDVKEVATLMCATAAQNGDNEMCSYQIFGSYGNLAIATYPPRIVLADNLEKVASDVNPGVCEKANDDMCSYQTFGSYGNLAIATYPPHIVLADNLEKVASDVNPGVCEKANDDMCSYQIFGSYGNLAIATYPPHIVLVDNLEKVASDVNPGVCEKANDDIINGDGDGDDDDDDDVNHGSCHTTTTTHAKNDVALKEDEDDKDGANNTNANKESHALIVHVVEDDVSNEDGIYSDGDTDDYQSLISNLVRMERLIHDNKEEVSEVESKEEDGLGDDWCYVSSSDVIDDWYLC